MSSNDTMSGAEGAVVQTGVSDYQKMSDSLDALRKNYNTYLRSAEETGFASKQQREQIRSWLAKLEQQGDDKEIRTAQQNFERYSIPLMQEEEKLYHEHFLKPLDEALENRVISAKSYKEWIQWVKDPAREADPTKASIKALLPKYLSERRKVAEERWKLLKDDRLKNISDSTLKASVDKLSDDRKYFETLSFSERKSLIDGIRADLAVQEGGEEYQKLRGKAEAILKKATEKPQPALHKDKVHTWLKRIFESKASPKDINNFLEGTDKQSLQGLIQTWREVAVHFWYARKDSAFTGIQSDFINTKAFLWLHYKERVAYVQKMHAKAADARALRSEAKGRIASAKFALDAGGADRWLNQYVFNGNHTLQELSGIVRGNMTRQLNEKVNIFDRYAKAMVRAKKYEGIRGMSALPRVEFLGTKYPRQKSYVVEMELRLDQLEKNRPRFLMIRNAMDREDWDDALELIADEEKKGVGIEDRKQLTSMQNFIKEHRKYSDVSQKEVGKKHAESTEIDQLINSLPSDLQEICIELCKSGAQCMRMFGWGSYNRDWCRRNGYLDTWREKNALITGKQQALQKERQRRKKGVVNETIEGETGEEEFIELSRTSATNVCLDISDAGAKNAMIRTVRNRRSDDRTWYWTNIIMHRGGALVSNEQQKSDTQKMYKIGRLLRTLESKGEHYQYRGSSVNLKQKMKNSTKGSVAGLGIAA